MARKSEENTYVRVRDGAGNEYLCPLDALKPSNQATEEELTNCVDDGTAGRHPSSITTRGES
jgi:hypothetical protein